MKNWTKGGGPNPLIRRTPPNNEEAERAVVAACFDSVGGFKELEVGLTPADFYNAWLSSVWESMVSLRERRLPIDYLALKNDLERRGVPIDEDRVTDLTVLECETVPTAANLNYYAKIVEAMSQKRRLIEVGARIVELGWSTAKVREVYDQASELLFTATTERTTQKITNASTLAAELLLHLNDPDRDPGVVSGWFALDQVVQCFRPGEISVLGARPSMGKTSLAQALAAAMLMRGERVGFVSLEMDRLQLACNSVGARVGVDTTRIRRGVFGEVEPGRIDDDVRRRESQATLEGVEWLAAFGDRYVIFDGVTNTVRDVGRILERMVQQNRIRVAFLDYMQLLSGTEHTRGGGRYAEITEVSIMLKRFARRLGIHLCVLAQLNRRVEERADKKPIMADLRDSGQVEQDADVIMLLHRPEYYWPEKEELRGLALLDVCKNRNGPTGVVRLRFDRIYTRFEPE